LYQFKEKALDNIYRMFPDPESSLMAGILFGVDTGLTQELQQAFKNTGTAHIIAISGFNISIIAGLFFAFFSKFLGSRRGALLAVIGIIFYTILVGGDAAVVRAAIMGSLALFAKQVGRRQFALNTLLAVALLMCLWNPLYIWDVGFQLSFFATLGLILYASRAASGDDSRWTRGVAEPRLVSAWSARGLGYMALCRIHDSTSGNLRPRTTWDCLFRRSFHLVRNPLLRGAFCCDFWLAPFSSVVPND
jgi:ComEC/Rec2-related protein